MTKDKAEQIAREFLEIVDQYIFGEKITIEQDFQGFLNRHNAEQRIIVYGVIRTRFKQILEKHGVKYE